MARGDGTASRKKLVIICVVAAVCILALALGLGLGLGLKKDDTTSTKTVDPPARIDCYPELRWGKPPADVKIACESRGCTYDPSTIDVLAPACYISPDSPLGAGYSVKNVRETSSGMTFSLQSRLSQSTQSRSTSRIEPSNLAEVAIEYLGENLLRVKVDMLLMKRS
jgi:Trefoil (P-type) domain